MDIVNAIILGIIQGLTEFLPVSSSGHLEIVKALLGDNSVPKESLLLTVVLHFATALSTIVIFRKDIIEVGSGLFSKNNQSFKFSFFIAISMIPAALIGFFFEESIEFLFGGQLKLVAYMLMITGVLLLFADKKIENEKNVGMLDSILIGIAQAIAILPGISRSGATISCAILLGINKEKAARFSFLMVIPLIFGKMGKDILSGNIVYDSAIFFPLIFGFISAFITGVFACKLMIRLVKNSNLKYFSYYCFVIAFVVLFSLLI
jgi:undecaprenyl-diphosphatase